MIEKSFKEKQEINKLLFLKVQEVNKELGNEVKERAEKIISGDYSL